MLNNLLSEFGSMSLQEKISFLMDQRKRVKESLDYIWNTVFNLQDQVEDCTINTVEVKAATIVLLQMLKNKAYGKSAKDYSADDWKELVLNSVDISINTDGASYSEFVFSLYYRAIDFTIESYRRLYLSCLDEDSKVLLPLEEIREKLSDLLAEFREAEIPEVNFIEEAEMLCLEASVRFVTLLTTAVLPARQQELIVNTSVLLFEIVRYKLYEQENTLLGEYIANQQELTESLKNRFDVYFEECQNGINLFNSALNKIMSSDAELSFDGSVELAELIGVDKTKYLKSRREVDAFFMD